MTPRIEVKDRSSQIQIPLNCVISPNNTNPEEPLNSLQSTESGNLEDLYLVFVFVSDLSTL